MEKTIEITYQGTQQVFKLKAMTSQLAAEIENQTMMVDTDGTVKPINGWGYYKNKKLELSLAETHDGKPITQAYVNEMPMAIRNTLLKIIADEEGAAKSFRELTG